MDFTFTDEQEMIARTSRELMDDLCSPEALRSAFEEGRQLNPESWRRLGEIGLMGALIPPAYGGLGLADIDFVLIAQEAGRAALPEPLVEHAGVGLPLLSELATNTRVEQLLRQAADGVVRLAISHPANPLVLAADDATHLILCREDAVHLVEKSQVRLKREPSIDALRRLFRLEAVVDEATKIATGHTAQAAIAGALERGALYTAAQCAGLCDRMIQIAVAYANERKQFGKVIGSYQAIKHALANVQIKLEFARPVLYAAAARVSDWDARARAAVSHAKLAAADAADLAARTAIQVHGAMGYSWEVDLHFYMKRAWALAGAWGDRNFHMRRLQSIVIGDEIALGPDRTFERPQG